MISYDSINRLFFLEGKTFSYIIYVGDDGYLQTAYYGPKINQDGKYIARNARRYLYEHHDINYEKQFDTAPLEYTSFGRLDYHEPTVIINRNGARMSRFRYISHETLNDVPYVEGMPAARYQGKTLRITVKDDFSDVYLHLNYVVFDDCEVIVRNIEIENKGDDVIIERAYSFCFGLPSCNYDLIDLQGDWGRERNIERNPLAHGVRKISSTKGKSSHQLNPYLALCSKEADEEHGDVYACSLIYSGNFTLIAEVNPNENVRVQGGISEYNFSWLLEKGKVFYTPQVVMTYANGLGESSRHLADFYRNHIINKKWVNYSRPIVINHWEATEMNYTEKDLLPIIDEAATLGIDTFVLDDGWFGVRWNDKAALGDWFVNYDKLHGGIKELSDRCQEKGLRFGIWFEPEMVCEDSNLFREHPEYAMMKKDVEPARWRNQLSLDFSNPEVIDCIYKQMKEIIDSCSISYIKWDMNRELSEYYSEYLPPERQGELMHRHILGIYSLAEKLQKEYPDILFEGCAGGGGRFDGAMFYYFPQIWTSDDTDAYERTKIQYGTSLFAPISTMSCHVSASPNVHTGRMIPIETRYAVASMGSFGYELNIAKLVEEDKQKIRDQVAHYHSIESLIRQGDLYRLKDPLCDNYFSYIVVSKQKDKAYLSITRTHFDLKFDYNTLKITGLDDDKQYHLKQIDLVASGKSLRNIGIDIGYLREYQSLIVDIEEI